MFRIPILLFAFSAAVWSQVGVLATTPDLADFASRIGGDLVVVESLTKGHEDLHLVVMRPSFLNKLRRADVLIELGLGAEHAWLPELVRNARNDRIRPGGSGHCDASAGIAPLEVPEASDRGLGPDIHPLGNPHFNLDPRSMRTAARNIRDVLVRALPGHVKPLDERYRDLVRQIDDRYAAWRKTLEPFGGAAFIEHHQAWIYFAESFDLRIVERLEPKPGVAPGAGHLSRVAEVARREGAGLIVARPASAALARRAAELTGAAAVLLPLSSTAEDDGGWFAFMDRTVKAFSENLRKPGNIR